MTKESSLYVGKLSDDFDIDDNKISSNVSELVLKYRMVIIVFICGVLILLIGVFWLFKDTSKSEEIIVLGAKQEVGKTLVVEVSGAVNTPGVYKVDSGLRIADTIEIAGGLKESADNEWIDKVLNRASFVEDGQKIYIPYAGKQTSNGSANKSEDYQSISSVNNAVNEQLVNINTSSAKELEALWGIGQVTAQNIIEQRPYSNVEDLLTRKIIKSNVYERNKDLLTVY
ncbi:ComEA family DNA-binding protein [Candidatus Woesebacteria bacterium]|nr:MAG: ComEA family DNA-binding protein [Candidatus Woesebacteria bacterium]